MFTVNNLPKEAQWSTADSAEHWRGSGADAFDLNCVIVTTLNRLDAAHGGRLSALLNGTAPAFTDEPPKQWAELTDEALIDMIDKANAAHASNAPEWPYVFNSERYEASRKLAVASLRASLSAYAPPPRKVEVTPEVMKAFHKAWDASEPSWALGSGAGFGSFYQTHIDGLRAAFDFANEQADARESEAVAEVARLNAVIEEMTKRHDEIHRTNENEREDLWNEKERLKGEVERLTKEREEAKRSAGEWLDKYTKAKYSEAALKAHAANLEAMLTVPGADGPVHAWKPMQILIDGKWVPMSFLFAGEIEYNGDKSPIYSKAYLKAYLKDSRQTPAPEAELKRWRVKSIWDDVEEHITKPMTRSDAEQIGEVRGHIE